MVVDEKHYHVLSNRAYSLSIIGELFDLTTDELDHPNCGDWIADNIKQLQTAQLTIKSMKMRSSENQKIENYNKDPFVNKPLSDVTNKPH